ncbi:hypothetical protein AB0E63_13510 [Kribbella sp. NPDC026596]|uniref:hypothetical protein n=1 Tax=Kribbella sp. NPDC026596 TaxID=3155122 RepID=UPI0033C15FEA
MDRQSFDEQFRARQWLLIDQVMDAVFEAQEDVFGLISELPAEDDRRAAMEMVEQADLAAR